MQEPLGGMGQPLLLGPGFSRCLLRAGPQPHRRLVGREEWAGTPTEPQALAAQLSWDRQGRGMGIPGPPLHSLRAGPLNQLRCPINRQQPCAAAQLQRLPPASPLPTRWSCSPGDDRLPHPWAALLKTCPDAARAPGEKPTELQREPSLGCPQPPEVTLLGVSTLASELTLGGVSTLVAEATLGQGVYTGLRDCPVWRSFSTLGSRGYLLPRLDLRS